MRQQKILSSSPSVAILSNKQTLSKTGLIWIEEVKTIDPIERMRIQSP